MISLAPATALANNNQSAPDLFDDAGIQQATNKVLPAKVVKGKNRSVNVHTDLLWSDALTLVLSQIFIKCKAALICGHSYPAKAINCL